MHLKLNYAKSIDSNFICILYYCHNESVQV
nr:MAG TPA: hypothetical protein [Caudoviricetes sp.]